MRLTVAISAGILVAILLLIGVIFWDNARHIARLDPEFTEIFQDALAARALQDEQRMAELHAVTLDYLQDMQGFNEAVTVLVRNFDLQSRLLVLAAMLALPFGLTAAILIARHVSRPIESVSRAARLVATGDLAARAEHPAMIDPASEGGVLISDFNQMASSLELLEEERQNMIADVAHELRTPLTVVQGQLDAMQYGVVPVDAEQLAKLNRHIGLLSRIIKDLRILSLADARRLSLDVTGLDLQALVHDIVDGFQDHALAEEISLVFEPAATGPVEVSVDGDRVAQVLINLLGNALRHTPSGGHVTVSIELAAGSVNTRVRDSGDGLPEGQLERVFQRFYRTDESRSRASGGTGLGLAISRAIAELHGGTLTARNMPGAGAEFTLVLPRKT